MKKLPIGIQGFEGLRRDGYLYVDKTSYIYRLRQSGKAYFLSRPRRFGKSLFLSALRKYWEGKKDLFEGLAIERLEKNHPEAWTAYPVFYFDFNGENYQTKGALEDALDQHLELWEKTYGLEAVDGTLGARFRNLLVTAREQTGLRCVVLVDEYDKPLLEAVQQPELEEHNKAVFRGFFSSLKGWDEYLQFVFITGVTKFEKVSIFSDLNQLNDISLSEEYAGICGITHEELTENFMPYIEETAMRQQMDTEDCLQALKKNYDGYHFHPYGVGVYNPYSLLKAFFDKDFGSYWFASGTPAYLVRKLKETGFDTRKLTDRTIYANEASLSDYRANSNNLIPLLYQTGYLTIVDYDRKRKRYTLGFPNEEVEYGFLQSLLPEYIPDVANGRGMDIFTLNECVEDGDLDGIRNIISY